MCKYTQVCAFCVDEGTDFVVEDAISPIHSVVTPPVATSSGVFQLDEDIHSPPIINDKSTRSNMSESLSDYPAGIDTEQPVRPVDSTKILNVRFFFYSD